eukprot:CAMPEP_0169164494 /NCGR_PEP_ID=MMETSP1015-20121227/58876_1 /TAXON_ID=342587 /ORGANISM="Karlodinium micrum, Strain CCMP2283" /LENGTH=181 /DNA_ID=CAMNT_0009236957 /DNA_START=27 /DNA_END=572 /DNA_ORIENTATION=+
MTSQAMSCTNQDTWPSMRTFGSQERFHNRFLMLKAAMLDDMTDNIGAEGMAKQRIDICEDLAQQIVGCFIVWRQVLQEPTYQTTSIYVARRVLRHTQQLFGEELYAYWRQELDGFLQDKVAESRLHETWNMTTQGVHEIYFVRGACMCDNDGPLLFPSTLQQLKQATAFLLTLSLLEHLRI